MLDVLVTCFPHGDVVKIFPQVRGFELARHLARAGLEAEYRPLPRRRGHRPTWTRQRPKARVVICSEYQQTEEFLDRHLREPLGRIRCERMYCMTDVTMLDNEEHAFSRPYCEWFAARGGVLCQAPADAYEPWEHYIGVGVDGDVVVPDAEDRRDRVVFDFPRSRDRDAASTFDPAVVQAVRSRLPDLCLTGTGPSDACIRELFDEWVPYGQPHEAYVRAAFSRAVAVVPGRDESLGLAMAEAQVAGACVVAPAGWVLPAMRVPEAGVVVDATLEAVADGISTATSRDHALVRRQALERFDYGAVVRRVREAIGV